MGPRYVLKISLSEKNKKIANNLTTAKEGRDKISTDLESLITQNFLSCLATLKNNEILLKISDRFLVTTKRFS